jgi:hypothetical protein
MMNAAILRGKDDPYVAEAKSGFEFLMDAGALEGAVLAYIEAGKNKTFWEVTASFARPGTGYGPLIYDIAMSELKTLAPDRVKTSPSAQKIWDFYSTKRRDVRKVAPVEFEGEIDRASMPDSLGHSYTGAKVKIQPMIQVHDSYATAVNGTLRAATRSRLLITPGEFEGYLKKAAWKHFAGLDLNEDHHFRNATSPDRSDREAITNITQRGLDSETGIASHLEDPNAEWEDTYGPVPPDSEPVTAAIDPFVRGSDPQFHVG